MGTIRASPALRTWSSLNVYKVSKSPWERGDSSVPPELRGPAAAAVRPRGHGVALAGAEGAAGAGLSPG